MASPAPIYYKQNRLKQLRAFCHAARTGSISEAADKVFLSQPTVSLQIQALERELETVLFERRGPKIRLTPEGKILFKLAQPLVEGMDKLQETFIAQQGLLESGDLNIAAGESTILYVLPEPLKQFMEQHPKIRVKLHNVTGGRDGLSRLRADEADFAVGSMLEVPDDIIYKPLVTYSPELIVPIGHPLAEIETITLKDIAPYGLILPPPSLTTWRMVDLVFRQHELKFKTGLEAGGWEVIKKYVELGMGISIVTDVCLTGEERLIKIPLNEYFPKRTYGIVLRRGKYLSPQAKRFIDMMEACYADDTEGSESDPLI
ncbi:LysR family transcriptional regulator [Sedimenticola thiotaurini]|uniref:LysR family transcriptional regulator n=1 Tax=Sedimenticola thiotaurini TaxID=1543721 RepID=A0A0F7JXE0_9GAMM|nr:LysR family transcriptional regulator [Sedimenticola thiotaurini]AKH19470.1 LysR family transcriptional regulator [Sedimenticola thiotaurini]